jgi:TPR repeat protein
MRIRLAALISALSLAAAPAAASAQTMSNTHLVHGGPVVLGAWWGGNYLGPVSHCHDTTYNCAVQTYRLGAAARSLPMFQRAAQLGSKDAMRQIGIMMLHGQAGLRADPAQAMGWFYEAAVRNDAPSMFMLSRAFRDGIGVPRDPALARFWLERAAEHDYADAREALSGRQ